MSILQIILALACFGIGFLIADSSVISTPWAIAIIVGVICIAMILRHFGHKKDK